MDRLEIIVHFLTTGHASTLVDPLLSCMHRIAKRVMEYNLDRVRVLADASAIRNARLAIGYPDIVPVIEFDGDHYVALLLDPFADVDIASVVLVEPLGAISPIGRSEQTLARTIEIELEILRCSGGEQEKLATLSREILRDFDSESEIIVNDLDVTKRAFGYGQFPFLLADERLVAGSVMPLFQCQQAEMLWGRGCGDESAYIWRRCVHASAEDAGSLWGLWRFLASSGSIVEAMNVAGSITTSDLRMLNSVSIGGFGRWVGDVDELASFLQKSGRVVSDRSARALAEEFPCMASEWNQKMIEYRDQHHAVEAYRIALSSLGEGSWDKNGEYQDTCSDVLANIYQTVGWDDIVRELHL